MAIIKSASFAISLDFAIPIFSTSSFACLIPAVSISFNGIPLMFTNSSIVSLVVPAYWVTMALSSFNMAFSSDDFPCVWLSYYCCFYSFFYYFSVVKAFF